MKTSLKERYIAAMVLSGVGDAIGYKKGEWEFCTSGSRIHQEAEKLGGVEKLKIKLPKWPVSDDTVLHLATAEALADQGHEPEKEKLYRKIAECYKRGMRDMKDRSAGNTCRFSVPKLRPGRELGYQIPFNERGGGCGAAMRGMCIGLRYPKPQEINHLIEVSIESGRMTHHHPTGYLGSLAGSLFTSFAIQKMPLQSWGSQLISILPKALQYVTDSKHCVIENQQNWRYFTDRWNDFIHQRGIADGRSEPIFPDRYGIEERDKFYKSVSFSGSGGSSGHDAPMIAYDALLGCKGDWIELCKRSMLHGGDSDSTGVMAACWFGALYGFKGVPPSHFEKLEYRERLEMVALKLYDLACLDQK